MKRILLLAILTYALVMVGLMSQKGDLLALAAPFLVYVGASVLFGPENVKLDIKRTLSATRVAQGSRITVHVKAQNVGRPIEMLSIGESSPLDKRKIEGHTSLLTGLETGETVEWEYYLKGDRGLYSFSGFEVHNQDYFGLVHRSKHVPAGDRVIILPRTARLKKVAIRPKKTMIYSGIIPARVGGTGTDFFGLKEYQPGDSPRLINWRAAARHPGVLYATQFEQERITEVGLILDARDSRYLISGNTALFEHAVDATAALAEALLKDGNRVGLFIFGSFVDWTFPGYGKVQRERILNSLAKATTGRHVIFDRLENLPTRLFPAGSQLIFISPLMAADGKTLLRLRARGYNVLVVSPDPISYEAQKEQVNPAVETARHIARLERRLMVNRLIQTGVNVLNWRVDTPFHIAAFSYFNRQILRQHR